MVCAVCGTERASDAAACDVCGASSDAPTVAASSSPQPIPASSHGARRSHAGGSDIDHGAFTPGTVLGTRYRIVGLLGRGGMGEVYRADDLTLGQPVALKFLRGDDPNLAARLRDETRTARQVSHPNVCRVHDVAEWNGRPFVSMEYVDGEDLASLLRRIGRLSPDKAVEIVRQVCAGLAAAHDRGVLHRDLKPANVMLDGRGQVRVTDFGLASFADDDRTGEIAGTPAYMAPEQIAGGGLSAQTDLYAVGLLLFELLAGTQAHGAASLMERRQQPNASKPPLPPSVRAAIDPRIVQVIDRCLEPDAARRPESALLIAAALPGGDPLAAALAAGETPAPHVVAAAADDHPLGSGAALACLIAFAAAVVALLAVNGLNVYSRYVPFRQSPEVLAARAEEIRQRLGYNDVPVDTARGFTTRGEYLAWQRARARGPHHWEHLQSLRPQLIVFWYRSSPRPLVAPVLARFGGAPIMLAASSAEPITAAGAASVDPGGSYLEIDPNGALNALLVRPSDDAARTAPRAPIDWTRLFVEARLDAASFSPVETSPVVPVFADTRAAWVGPAPDGSGVQLQIEAAALAGRPVYFRILAPWTKRDETAAVAIETVLFVLLCFLLVVVGAVLARRNLQSGRSDQQGALRVAATVGLVLLAAQLLEAHHTPTGAEAFVVIGALSWALFVAAFTWLSYVALEPYVRRHWPEALIGWARLLAGRWRDRRVGRDLLIGAIVGLAGVVIDRVAAALGGWRTGDSVIWRIDLDALSSAGTLAAAFLRSLALSTAWSIDLLFLLLLLRVFSPRPWLASWLAVAILVGLGFGTFTDPLVQLPLAIASAALPVVLLTRYGLLAGATSLFVDSMSAHVIASLDLSQFFGRTMVAGVLLLAAPALLGFYISVAGRSLVVRRFDLSETPGASTHT
jgi:serine/threonine-protein kinase